MALSQEQKQQKCFIKPRAIISLMLSVQYIGTINIYQYDGVVNPYFISKRHYS
uniref:Uncharacterized protein n=1 Tax=Aeromonas hydrophila TaxID=644 RepID=A0A346ACA8_AERHY|nr:hypothetical protein [Aeromonas hydrophila]